MCFYQLLFSLSVSVPLDLTHSSENHSVARPVHITVDLCLRSQMAVWVISHPSSLQKVLLHMSFQTYLYVFLMYEVLGLAL